MPLKELHDQKTAARKEEHQTEQRLGTESESHFPLNSTTAEFAFSRCESMLAEPGPSSEDLDRPALEIVPEPLLGFGRPLQVDPQGIPPRRAVLEMKHQAVAPGAAMLNRPELVAEVSPPEIDPLGYVVADTTRLRGLGWQPEFSLPQGLETLMRSL